MAQGSFGRRAAPMAPLRAAPRPAASPAAEIEGLFAPRADAARPAPAIGLTPEEQELAAWKAARKKGFRLPLKQMSLIASLSFGIASFVLPDDIGDWVNWLLYGLSGASFIVWLKGMFGKKA